MKKILKLECGCHFCLVLQLGWSRTCTSKECKVRKGALVLVFEGKTPKSPAMPLHIPVASGRLSSAMQGPRGFVGLWCQYVLFLLAELRTSLSLEHTSMVAYIMEMMLYTGIRGFVHFSLVKDRDTTYN